MKAMRFGLVLAGACALLLQVSCGNPLGDDPLNPDGETDGYTGTLSSALTLEAGSYRVTGGWSIEAPLVLQPGTTLLFDAGASLTISANGSISAVGTAQSPITFTSAKVTKSAGDWEGVFIYANSSRFEYCAFSYAEDALVINTANNTVDHCTFTSNVVGLDASSNDAGASIRDSTFASNETPFKAGRFDLNDSNTFTGNTKQYVEVSGDILQGTARHWSLVSVPLVVTYDIYVDGDLTIAPGARLLFQAGRDLTVSVNGSVTAEGEAGKRIVFSSAKTGTKAPGDWEGLYVQGNSSSFEYCDFEYAAIGLAINGNSTTIRHCAFTSNATGLKADSSDISSMTVGDTSFTGNGTPFQANAAYDLDDTISFSGNDKQYIEMYGDIAENRSWAVSSVPLRFAYDTYIDGGTLSLGAGTVLAFAADRSLIVSADGGMSATGTVEAPVIFTSAATAKARSDWVGIDVRGTATLGRVVIEYANYGLTLNDGSNLTITDSTLQHCYIGIFMPDYPHTKSGITYIDNTYDLND